MEKSLNINQVITACESRDWKWTKIGKRKFFNPKDEGFCALEACMFACTPNRKDLYLRARKILKPFLVFTPDCVGLPTCFGALEQLLTKERPKDNCVFYGIRNHVFVEAGEIQSTRFLAYTALLSKHHPTANQQAWIHALAQVDALRPKWKENKDTDKNLLKNLFKKFRTYVRHLKAETFHANGEVKKCKGQKISAKMISLKYWKLLQVLAGFTNVETKRSLGELKKLFAKITHEINRSVRDVVTADFALITADSNIDMSDVIIAGGTTQSIIPDVDPSEWAKKNIAVACCTEKARDLDIIKSFIYTGKSSALKTQKQERDVHYNSDLGRFDFNLQTGIHPDLISHMVDAGMPVTEEHIDKGPVQTGGHASTRNPANVLCAIESNIILSNIRKNFLRNPDEANIVIEVGGKYGSYKQWKKIRNDSRFLLKPFEKTRYVYKEGLESLLLGSEERTVLTRLNDFFNPNKLSLPRSKPTILHYTVLNTALTLLQNGTLFDNLFHAIEEELTILAAGVVQNPVNMPDILQRISRQYGISPKEFLTKELGLKIASGIDVTKTLTRREKILMNSIVGENALPDAIQIFGNQNMEDVRTLFNRLNQCTIEFNTDRTPIRKAALERAEKRFNCRRNHMLMETEIAEVERLVNDEDREFTFEADQLNRLMNRAQEIMPTSSWAARFKFRLIQAICECREIMDKWITEYKNQVNLARKSIIFITTDGNNRGPVVRANVQYDKHKRLEIVQDGDQSFGGDVASRLNIDVAATCNRWNLPYMPRGEVAELERNWRSNLHIYMVRPGPQRFKYVGDNDDKLHGEIDYYNASHWSNVPANEIFDEIVTGDIIEPGASLRRNLDDYKWRVMDKLTELANDNKLDPEILQPLIIQLLHLRRQFRPDGCFKKTLGQFLLELTIQMTSRGDNPVHVHCMHMDTMYYMMEADEQQRFSILDEIFDILKHIEVRSHMVGGMFRSVPGTYMLPYLSGKYQVSSRMERIWNPKDWKFERLKVSKVCQVSQTSQHPYYHDNVIIRGATVMDMGFYTHYRANRPSWELWRTCLERQQVWGFKGEGYPQASFLKQWLEVNNKTALSEMKLRNFQNSLTEDKEWTGFIENTGVVVTASRFEQLKKIKGLEITLKKKVPSFWNYKYELDLKVKFCSHDELMSQVQELDKFGVVVEKDHPNLWTAFRNNSWTHWIAVAREYKTHMNTRSASNLRKFFPDDQMKEINSKFSIFGSWKSFTKIQSDASSILDNCPPTFLENDFDWIAMRHSTAIRHLYPIDKTARSGKIKKVSKALKETIEDLGTEDYYFEKKPKFDLPIANPLDNTPNFDFTPMDMKFLEAHRNKNFIKNFKKFKNSFKSEIEFELKSIGKRIERMTRSHQLHLARMRIHNKKTLACLEYMRREVLNTCKTEYNDRVRVRTGPLTSGNPYEWDGRSDNNKIFAFIDRHNLPRIEPTEEGIRNYKKIANKYFDSWNFEEINLRKEFPLFDEWLQQKKDQWGLNKLDKYFKSILRSTTHLSKYIDNYFPVAAKSGEDYYTQQALEGVDKWGPVEKNRPRMFCIATRNASGVVTYGQNQLWKWIKKCEPGFIQGMNSKEMAKTITEHYDHDKGYVVFWDGSAFDSTQSYHRMEAVDDNFWMRLKPFWKNLLTANGYANPKIQSEKVVSDIMQHSTALFVTLNHEIPLEKRVKWSNQERKLYEKAARTKDIKTVDGDPNSRVCIFYLKGTTFSGHPTKTTLGNTLRSIVDAHYYAAHAKLRPNQDYWPYASGDDVLVVTRNKIVAEKLKGAVNSLSGREKILWADEEKRITAEQKIGIGQIIPDEAQVVKLQNADFCSKRFILSKKKKWVLVRDINKVLFTRNEYTGDNKLMQVFPELHAAAILDQMRAEKVSRQLEHLLEVRLANQERLSSERLSAFTEEELNAMRSEFDFAVYAREKYSHKQMAITDGEGYEVEDEVDDLYNLHSLDLKVQAFFGLRLTEE